MYKIVRKFFTSTLRLECGDFWKEFQHPFTPLTLEEATIIKSKLCTPEFAIDVIEIIDENEKA